MNQDLVTTLASDVSFSLGSNLTGGPYTPPSPTSNPSIGANLTFNHVGKPLETLQIAGGDFLLEDG